jgi:pilus assembly protein FimV
VVRVIKPVTVLRLASAAALSLPLFALAAGLGQMSVQSYLGQPLRVEIEIMSLQPGEENSLDARLASGNAFAQAGIEFSPALTGLLFSIERREGRSPVLRVTSRQPVNEPFLDMLVELRWDSGLLVREYTVLLDPPEYRAPKPVASAPALAPEPATRAAASPSVLSTVPAAAPSAAAPEASSAAPSGAVADAVKPEARAEERPIAAAAPAESGPAPAEAKPAAEATTYEVKKGDTLGAIARRYRPEGVTFNQMLIALQRANEDAFIRNNVNLVRAGRILNIPDSDTLAAVDAADANRLVIAQHADFAEYRNRLATAVAAAPSAPAPAEQSAAGQITPKPEEPKPAAPKDQLKLSKADAKKPGAPAARAAKEDDAVARERALKEAQSRVGDLEKNVADLQKMLELQNQRLAEASKQAAATKPSPTPAPTAKAPEPPKPAPAPQAAKAPEAKPAAPPPAKPAAGTAKPVAEASKPAAEAAKPAAEAPKPPPAAPAPVAAKPKPKPVASPPSPPEPNLVDEFLDNPVALPGLGVVILLLGGYGAWAWQRKKKSASSKFQDSVLGAPSVAPAAAGAAAAAAAGPASSSQVSVSQSAVAGMDADDVDPIAEADVYMAYGRDAQAEEILKEALQKDANRLPVHAKLLEIYANRRDAKSFEQSALKLKSLTNSSGPDWDKATALGRSIDPGNGLYGGAGNAPAAPAPAPVAAAPAPMVDFDIGGGAGGDASAAAAPALDLDLGGASVPAQEQTDFSPGGTLIIDSNETKAASSGLDFDLGGASEKPADTGGGLNFELPASVATAAEATPAPSTPAASGGLDFDLNLGGSDAKAEAPAAPAMDLSEISLDLGTAAPAAGAGADPKWQEVATKLDLAKAYEEMGDKDGARELLNEVVREGDGAQQAQANQMLAKLG